MSFDENSLASIELAKEAALQILLHNAQGPFQGLPRTAGWGYPEPYTRDLMISVPRLSGHWQRATCGCSGAHAGGACQ